LVGLSNKRGGVGDKSGREWETMCDFLDIRHQACSKLSRFDGLDYETVSLIGWDR
jgi:hypothetical protein